MAIFATNLISLRKERGWTQEMLAQFTGLSQVAIALIEGEKNWPSRETVTKLAEAFNVPEPRLFLPPDYLPEPTLAQAIAVIAKAHDLEVSPPKKKRKKKTL